MENPRSDLKDMHGTVCVVTGANSGIGKATATGLARLGARVVMVCRNRERGRDAQAEIRATAERAHPSSADTVDLQIADLAVQEEVYHLGETIRAAGCNVGVALNPATPLGHLDGILPFVDLVLVMSVNPGFSGQSYIPESTAKVQRVRRQLNALGSSAHLEVDGGVAPNNAMELIRAGADVLVAGNAVFGGDQPVAQNIEALRNALTLKV